jgi:hypothetical protein
LIYLNLNLSLISERSATIRRDVLTPPPRPPLYSKYKKYKKIIIDSFSEKSADSSSTWKKEEALKREEARKRSIAQMKKNWKSQFLSLGMNKPSKSSKFKESKLG